MYTPPRAITYFLTARSHILPTIGFAVTSQQRFLAESRIAQRAPANRRRCHRRRGRRRAAGAVLARRHAWQRPWLQATRITRHAKKSAGCEPECASLSFMPSATLTSTFYLHLTSTVCLPTTLTFPQPPLTSTPGRSLSLASLSPPSFTPCTRTGCVPNAWGAASLQLRPQLRAAAGTTHPMPPSGCWWLLATLRAAGYSPCCWLLAAGCWLLAGIPFALSLPDLPLT